MNLANERRNTKAVSQSQKTLKEHNKWEVENISRQQSENILNENNQWEVEY